MEERKSRRLGADKLWEYALKSLGSRAQSIGELREKLRRRAERASDIDGVLSRLKEIGYLNDKRYAESFASARLSNEGLGRMRVVQELRVRRVAPAVAERTVDKVYEGIDEQKLIEEWIRRKYRTAAREGLFQDQKDLAAAYRRLARAGFRTGGIITALKRFAKEPELLDGFEPPEEMAEE
jgi:regulatory protein